jgi:hypothetical protein
MGEAQEVERLGPSLTTPLPFRCGEPTELVAPGLRLVKLQAELGQSLPGRTFTRAIPPAFPGALGM